MKSFLLLSLTLFSLQTLAEVQTLDCATFKQEVKMHLVRSDKAEHKTNAIEVSMTKSEAYKAAEGETVSREAEAYVALISEGAGALNNSENVIVGQQDSSKKRNGGHSNSLLIHLSGTAAKVAWNGTVYSMNCSAE